LPRDAYRRVDDRPFGGGPGMVMLAEPLERALAAVRADRGGHAAGGALHAHRPRARPGRWCSEMAAGPGAVLLCGRYEGIDQRFIDRHVTLELSLGDFVLSGGELPALALLDAVARLQPGVLNAPSHEQDSFSDGLLEGPALQPARTLAPPRATGRCRRCCCRATTATSPAGGASVRWNSRRAAGPT
jgi:tRNA (guanine37-N1)-methyltransferase